MVNKRLLRGTQTNRQQNHNVSKQTAIIEGEKQANSSEKMLLASAVI
ncbi:MAG: hypothetical protein HC903_16635 [Methylacidiphilales bacterium]|nr:hypothetical protein [Candidatus Methylacidiphilales bacterium]NJR19909.1 hypothetical protein [Calothrix sp. CSU_2_0]